MNEPRRATGHIVDIQIATADDNIPSEAQFRDWASAALANQTQVTELTIRLVGLEESQKLNHQFRNKNRPTNVLSFPAPETDLLDIPFLGDLAICVPVVEQEAVEQNKLLDAHWAHMVIHGVLHLQGHDHETPQEAEQMEALEVKLLTDMGFKNPYEP